MQELKVLEKDITTRLGEIRDKKTKTLNEINEYKDLQKKLIEIHNVMIYIQRNKERKI